MASRSDKSMAGARQGVVLRLERSSIHDGAGLRTVVFLKGCPLACRWCSTPESQRARPERGHVADRCRLCGACVDGCPAGALALADGGIVWDRDGCQGCLLCARTCPHEAVRAFGRIMTVDEVVAEICRDEIFFFHSGGGVTISGGECLQQADFVAAMLAECRRQGIDTAIETSLCAPWPSVEAVLPFVETLFVDIKHPDPVRHREYVGIDNRIIFDNLRKVDECELPLSLIVRLPLVPGINDDDSSLLAVLDLAQGLKKIRALELLPYHRLGVGTYRQLRRDYLLEHVDSPSPDHIMERLRFLRDRAAGLQVRVGGGFA